MLSIKEPTRLNMLMFYWYFVIGDHMSRVIAHWATQNNKSCIAPLRVSESTKVYPTKKMNYVDSRTSHVI